MWLGGLTSRLFIGSNARTGASISRFVAWYAGQSAEPGEGPSGIAGRSSTGHWPITPTYGSISCPPAAGTPPQQRPLRPVEREARHRGLGVAAPGVCVAYTTRRDAIPGRDPVAQGEDVDDLVSIAHR